MKGPSPAHSTEHRPGPGAESEVSVGSRGIAMAPPISGVDFVDRARAANETGLPGNLMAGIESLSGLPMDDVRVHRNSPRPAALDALAYTQGLDIHVGPGQEWQLPHEAWHAVQQKRGQVQPTLQAKGVAVNDEDGLEREADAMGARAAGASIPAELLNDRSTPAPFSVTRPKSVGQREPTAIQRKPDEQAAHKGRFAELEARLPTRDTKRLRESSLTPEESEEYAGQLGTLGSGASLATETKLAINEPGDKYEQEAERVADQVMAAHAQTGVSSAPPHVQRVAGQTAGQMDAAPASVDQALASPSRPLDPALRQDMEQRFGFDFAPVRFHTGEAAEQSAQAVSARAYTVGHHVLFGAGRFAPGVHEGRKLIAHELTHVVQQGSSGRRAIQLAPDDAGAQPDAATALPTRIPANEKEAIEDTAKAYPTNDAVRGAITDLPDVVKAALGSDVEYQRKFLYRTSLYLGPHPKPIEHFRGITPFRWRDSDPSKTPDIYLHADVVACLEDVKRVIGPKNMPDTSVGFALRDLIRRADVPPPGLMVHALGYAIDFRAVLNPRFTDTRLVAVQALYTHGPTTFHVQTGPWLTRRETITKMGRGEIARGSQEEKNFIERFRLEAIKDLAGNIKIKQAIEPNKLKELRDIRPKYKDVIAKERAVQKKLDAEEKLRRGTPIYAPERIKELLPLVAEWSELELKRENLIAATQRIFGPLMQKVTDEIAAMRAFPYVTVPDKEYEKSLQKLSQDAKDATEAERKADFEWEKARADYNQYEAAIARLDAQVAAEKVEARRERLRKQLEDKRAAMVNTVRPRAKESLARSMDAHGIWLKATEELGRAKNAGGKRQWVSQLESLQTGLSVEGFDPKLVFGIGGKEGEETDTAVANPSLVQLFWKGFFNIDPSPAPAPPVAPTKGRKSSPKAPETPHGFTLEFMEEMAKHGFDQGTEWNPGGVDSMHFEFAEGVHALHKPTTGKD